MGTRTAWPTWTDPWGQVVLAPGACLREEDRHDQVAGGPVNAGPRMPCSKGNGGPGTAVRLAPGTGPPPKVLGPPSAAWGKLRHHRVLLVRQGPGKRVRARSLGQRASGLVLGGAGFVPGPPQNSFTPDARPRRSGTPAEKGPPAPRPRPGGRPRLLPAQDRGLVKHRGAGLEPAGKKKLPWQRTGESLDV